ncbi:MAG: type 1 glutamine amidotransferase [Limisphaerales bacterium]|jgi:type 1 glutamine amidotransferase
MKSTIHKILAMVALSLAVTTVNAATMRALIVDGQNNHNWKDTSPLLKKYLESTGLFTVEVATSPGKKQDMSGFSPKFADYDVVVSNYNGDEWAEGTKRAFEKYISSGGGLVVVHAADNSFSKWPEYNEMIAVGGWGGRSEKSGPYLYWDAKAKQAVKDVAKGRGGSHAAQHPFQIQIRNADHPITKGMPKTWMHAKDELYFFLRGPAKNVEILATTHATAQRESGRHEPMMMTIKYGKGRVFHTPMGHARDAKAPAFLCTGFITTVQRGAEWVATGKVTQKLPSDFPTADEASLRN